MIKKILLVNFFLFFILLTGSGQSKIKMIFRYDDYLLKPSRISDSVLYFFQKNDIPLCIAIIPFNKNDSLIYGYDSAKINDLKERIQRKEIEVALHGYNHVNESKTSFFRKKMYSEFAGVNYETQYEKIAKGKKALDSLLQINTDIFVPPFNTYDKNTLKALADLNFKILSANMRGTSGNNLINYMPATCEDFSELHDIIKNNKNNDVTIIFYFHPYSFKEGSSEYSENSVKSIEISKFNTLIHWIKKQNIRFYTFSDLARTENFSEAVYRYNSLKYNLLKKVLNHLKLYRYGAYSNMKPDRLNNKLVFGNIILHILAFLIFYFVTNFIIKFFHLSKRVIKMIVLICAVPSLIFLYYIRNDFSFMIILIMFLVIFTAILFSITRIFMLLDKSENHKISGK